MIIIKNNEINEISLNINNSTRVTIEELKLTFTHVMSKDVKVYEIDVNDNTQYGANDRYCEVVLDLIAEPVTYNGQYELVVEINDYLTALKTIAEIEPEVEVDPFTEYQSDNEDNENYIYIE